MSSATSAATTAPRPLDTEMQTGHVGLNVTDLARSTAFYQEVLGLSVVGGSQEVEREYAFLADTKGRLVLTLWHQSTDTFDTTRPGLHHLSFQVADIDVVREAEQRVRALGARLFHDGIVPHGEGRTSGGIFFEDPDGIRLEIYAPAGIEGTDAPTPGAPTCGFF